MKTVYMSRENLLAVIDDIRTRVSVGYSYEGFLNYLMPEEGDPPDGFLVEARWRVGNLQGQGGMRVIGDLS